jgi:DNA polymerase-3 subunit gamma/tau
MSYQVLARKWRPKKFKELMGQEHVVTVLVNALEQQRLHHAYLFTGTRGVGKTTIARIFAKSLNCQTGITTEPCGECDTCKDIDLGRFVDLIEIDAASKTKVDDTREILDNVQYAPTSGRYKVYLIDEVHMLSRSSFNALLKTLEEPPEHVKFILATTDPQKLPVTVLSRCLQFHLKALTVSQIEQQLNIILAAENVETDKGSVNLLAKAARGSMRDSLSLTDQSIAQGAGQITLSNVQKMLGGVDQSWVYKILIALIKQDAQQLMSLSLNIASYSPSYSRLMAELIQLLHQIAMVQIVDKHFDLSPEQEVLLRKFAQAMSPEDVQLYYQIVLNGRKDLPYAADEQAAFDMILLRLLAFKPVKNESEIAQQALAISSSPNVSFDDVNLPDTLNKTPSSEPVIRAVDETQQSEVSQPIAEQPKIEQPVDSLIEQPIQPTSEQALPISVDNGELENESTPVEQQLFDEMASIEALAAEQTQVEPLHDNAQQVDNQENYGHIPHAAEFEKSEADVVSEVEMQNSEPVAAQPQQSSQQTPSNEYAEQHQVQHEPQNQAQPQVEQQPIQTQSVQESSPTPVFTSPVESALATRNILRSRKKEMEAKAKKSSDAPVRHDSEKDSDVITVEEKPEFEAIEMVTDEPYRPELIDPSKIKSANQVDKWSNMIDSMALSARIRQIAIHATICESSTDEHLILLLDQSTKHLKTDTAVQQLQQSLTDFLKKPVGVEINVVEATEADPYKIQSDINGKRYEYAVNLLKEDDIVVALQQSFQAELDESTIQAL